MSLYIYFLLQLGRRSINQEEKLELEETAFIEEEDKQSPKLLSQDSDMKTLPFVWERDHIRFRRTHKISGCEATDVHYMLFVLDTSGSIGRRNFNNMTEAIGNISHYFCKQIQVAFMTYNHDIHLEFCFNCHGNDPQGRSRLNQTIRSIQYRGGMTHTAGAARCACSQVLQPSCGLPNNAGCLDVVFITDGHSNDPNLRICNEVRCLHRHAKNTFAIGIENYNSREINCIAKHTDDTNVFKYKSFEEFVKVLNQAIGLLKLSNGAYQCLTHAGTPNNKKK